MGLSVGEVLKYTQEHFEEMKGNSLESKVYSLLQQWGLGSWKGRLRRHMVPCGKLA